MRHMVEAHLRVRTVTRSGGRAAGYMGSDRRGEEDDGEEGVQRGVSLLAHTLASIASQLHARPHPFCLGPVSQQLGARCWGV